MQALYHGESVDRPYYPLQSATLHYFGGTTGHWSGYCSPFDPIDFEKRDWVPHSGWPFDRQHLDPFYARANKVLEATLPLAGCLWTEKRFSPRCGSSARRPAWATFTAIPF